MLHPSSGTGQFVLNTTKIIRYVRKGCANRPFYHIVVAEKFKDPQEDVIEQLGTYDPLANQHNEKLVSINFERLRHWIGRGAQTTEPIKELLGLCGFYPVYPSVYMTAWRRRKQADEDARKAAAQDVASKESGVKLDASETSS